MKFQEIYNRLYPYQREALKFLESKKGRALLSLDMGLGKTVTALAYVAWCREKELLTNLTVLCPSSVTIHWFNHIREWLGIKRKEIKIIEQKTDLVHLIDKNKIKILPYSVLSRNEKLIRLLIKSIKTDLLIIDELHYCKNLATSRSKTTYEISMVSQKVIGLTGTPMPNSPQEIIPQIKIITGLSLKNSKLSEIFKNFVYRKTAQEVFKDMPPFKRVVIPVKSSGKVLELSKATEEVRNKVTGKEKYMYITAFRKEAFNSKKEAVFEILEQSLNSYPKVVVFCWHHEAVEAIKKWCHDKGLNYSCITGETPSSQRENEIDKFWNDKSCRVFIGNIIAAGMGLNLQIANICIFAELDFVPENLRQAEKRIYRIGTRLPCFAYYIICKETIEEKIVSILNKKFSAIQNILQDKQERHNLIEST